MFYGVIGFTDGILAGYKVESLLTLIFFIAEEEGIEDKSRGRSQVRWLVVQVRVKCWPERVVVQVRLGVDQGPI